MTGKKTPAVPIGALFFVARRAARHAKMEEYRAATMRRSADMASKEEAAARSKNIGRMRAQSRAQLTSGLARQGVDPTLLMATGGGAVGGSSAPDPATASFIAQAAARQK